MRLEGAQLAVEAVVGGDPGLAWRVGAAIAAGDRDSRRRGIAGSIDNADPQRRHGLRVLPSFCQQRALCPGLRIENPDRRVAAAVGDEGNLFSIGRPAWIGVLVIAVGQRKDIATMVSHHPELVRLAAQVRGIDHALAVGRPIGPGLPSGFFVMNLRAGIVGWRRHDLQAREWSARHLGWLRGRSDGLGIHPPETPGAVDVSAVGDVDDLFAIGRPGRAYLVVHGAVVIAGQRAAILAAELLDHRMVKRGVAQIVRHPFVEIEHENMEVSGLGGGNIGDALAIG